MDPRPTQELIEAYRRVEAPSASQQDRMLELVRSRVLSGSAPDASVDLPPPAVAMASRLPWWLGLAGAGAGVLGLVVALAARDPEHSRAVVTAAAQVPMAQVPPTAPVLPPLAGPPAAPPAAAVVSATAESAATTDALEPRAVKTRAPRPAPDVVETVDAEVSLIKEARSALKGGNATNALRLLLEHERRFPDGVMVELRDVFRVEALCGAGRQEAAGEAAAAFVRQHPRSPYTVRVADACPDAPP